MADSKITKPLRKISSSIAIAKAAIRRGWAPIPLLPKSKAIRRPGWPDLRIKEEELEQYFKPDSNVGILWGKASDGAVDVDLDSDETVAVAPFLLPETYIYGRDNRPSSHYIYRVSDPPNTQEWVDPTVKGEGKKIVELRSTGSQSVWVGSTHPDGDKYIVNHEVEVTDIAAERLIRLCSQVAAVGLLARNYAEGSRHDYIHAVAGALLHDGHDVDNVRRLLNALLRVIEDEESEQRERTIENTIKRHGNGKKGHTRGWPTLSQWIDEDTIASIREYLKSTQRRSAPKLIEVTDTRKDPPPEKPAPLKIERTPLELPDGLTKDLMTWISNRSYVIRPELDLGAALMCTALASGNRYIVEGRWSTPLQPYIMMLAPTGTGKDSSLSAVQDFATRKSGVDGMGRQVFGGFQSYQALLDVLAEEHAGCWLWDEAARKLKTSANPQSPDYQVFSHILSMYGKGASTIAGMPARGQPIPPIEHPFFTILAAAQPSQMADAIAKVDLDVGILGRFLLLDSGTSPRQRNIRRCELFPSSIRARLQKFREVQLPSNGELPFVRIQFDPKNNKVFNRFDQFDDYAANESNKEHAELWNRANQNALIVAGLLAIGRDSAQRPVITMELAEYAIELSRRSVHDWMSRLRKVARTEHEGLVQKLEDWICNCEKHAPRAQGQVTWTALMKAGYMPAAMLRKICRESRGRDFEDGIKQLLDEGTIGQGDRSIKGSRDVDCYYDKRKEQR